MNTTTTPMFNIDSQKQLARLLAKENITIRVANYHTAFFDVKNRVLGLPAWNVNDKNVADLLVGHEVGHACFTPHDAIDSFYQRFGNSAPFDIANIVEDIRIERMIMDTYPGLISPFKAGYRYFIENDFFKIKGKDISTLQFVDRLNIKGKLRDFVDIQFNKEEDEIYQRCLTAETYEDVLEICSDIITYIKNETHAEITPRPSSYVYRENDDKTSESEGDQISVSSHPTKDKTKQSETVQDETPAKSVNDDISSDADADADADENKPVANSADNSAKAKQKTNNPPPPAITANISTKSLRSFSTDDAFNKLKSETLRAVEDQLESLQANLSEVEINNPIRSMCMEYVVPLAIVRQERRARASIYNEAMSSSSLKAEWTEFKAKSKSYVSVLVKEFERRKSAYEYSRSTQAELGQINVNKLHAYRYDDNIFKTVSRLATSKNHGMLFFIDFSGSMGSVIKSVIEQTLQLVFFCKAVGIPFEVYGFTGNAYSDNVEHKSLPIGENINLRCTTVFEIINSNLNKNEHDEVLRETYINYCSHAKGGDSSVFMNRVETMGSTPYFQSIVIASFIAKDFRKRTGVQKLNTLFINDGDSARLNTLNERADHKYLKGKDASNVFHWHGHKISLGSNSEETHRNIIRAYKAITGSTAVCFFIPTQGRHDYNRKCTMAYVTSEAYPKIKNWTDGSVFLEKEKRKAATKTRFIYIKGGYGYDGYFVLSNSQSVCISDDDDFKTPHADEFVSNAASRNKLARAFTKHTGDKKESRIFLTKFIDMIS